MGSTIKINSNWPIADFRCMQEVLGHKDVKSAMAYTHVINKGGMVYFG